MENIYNPHVSVDCVVFGFDGEHLKVLLLERHITESDQLYNDKKLPGSIIYENEDIDSAAARVLFELTGLKNAYLSQFHSFGNPDRIKNPRDILWLEKTTKLKIGRIVTIGYMALMRISRKLPYSSEDASANWYNVNEISRLHLAFDHLLIIQTALEHIRHQFYVEPHLFFELLPRKFTMLQLRRLYDTVYNVKSDVRNFQKRMKQQSFLEELDEFEQNVAHRAARLYKFKNQAQRNGYNRPSNANTNNHYKQEQLS